MCNEIKKVQNNKMCKKQYDVQKTIRCAKKMCKKNNKMCKKDVQKNQQDVQKNNKMYKKEKTVYWDLIYSNVNKRDVQTGCSWYCT